jgi:hypothetical protein
MMTDDFKPQPENDSPGDDFSDFDTPISEEVNLDPDELRYAPLEDEEAESFDFDDDVLEETPAEAAPLYTRDWSMPDDDDVLGVVEATDLDIDSALAAVSSLSDMIAEQEAQEQAIAAAQAEQEAREAEFRNNPMPKPPLSSLQRGQLASVLPGLLLIAIGAWLTFTLTTATAPPPPGITTAVVTGAVALIFLAHWISTGRWSRGSLFLSIGLLLSAGVIAFLLQPASPGLGRGWPLLLAALGLTFILSAFLARPARRGFALPGFLMIVGGLVGVAALNLPLPGNLLPAVAASRLTCGLPSTPAGQPSSA